jgi:hypothetical protein
VLEFDHKTMTGAHIRDVLFAGSRIKQNHLLPFDRELGFPDAMPLRFLPPDIALFLGNMRPVPSPMLAASGCHGLLASGT